jgi:hypothetical protein
VGRAMTCPLRRRVPGTATEELRREISIPLYVRPLRGGGKSGVMRPQLKQFQESKSKAVEGAELLRQSPKSVNQKRIQTVSLAEQVCKYLLSAGKCTCSRPRRTSTWKCNFNTLSQQSILLKVPSSGWRDELIPYRGIVHGDKQYNMQHFGTFI